MCPRAVRPERARVDLEGAEVSATRCSCAGGQLTGALDPERSRLAERVREAILYQPARQILPRGLAAKTKVDREVLGARGCEPSSCTVN